jgi:hypothetical protein
MATWNPAELGEYWYDAMQNYQLGGVPEGDDWFTDFEWSGSNEGWNPEYVTDFWTDLLMGGGDTVPYIDIDAEAGGLNPYTFMFTQSEWFNPDYVSLDAGEHYRIGEGQELQTGLTKDVFRTNTLPALHQKIGSTGFATSGYRPRGQNIWDELYSDIGEIEQETQAAYSEYYGDFGNTLLENIGISADVGGLGFQFADEEATSWDDAMTGLQEDYDWEFLGTGFTDQTWQEQLETCVNTYLLGPTSELNWQTPTGMSVATTDFGFTVEETEELYYSTGGGPSSFVDAIEHCRQIGETSA